MDSTQRDMFIRLWIEYSRDNVAHRFFLAALLGDECPLLLYGQNPSPTMKGAKALAAVFREAADYLDPAS